MFALRARLQSRLIRSYFSHFGAYVEEPHAKLATCAVEQGGPCEAPKEVCTCTSVPSYFVLKAARGVPCVRAGAAGAWSPAWPWQDGNVPYPSLTPPTPGLPSPRDLQTRAGCLLRNRVEWDRARGDESHQTPGTGVRLFRLAPELPSSTLCWRDLFPLWLAQTHPRLPCQAKLMDVALGFRSFGPTRSCPFSRVLPPPYVCPWPRSEVLKGFAQEGFARLLLVTGFLGVLFKTFSLCPCWVLVLRGAS